LAVIHGHAAFADAPALFPTAPIGAIDMLMKRTGWNLAEVDLFEINEAFAVVTLAAMKHLDLPHARSISMAAPVRWATRSALQARGFW